MNHPLPKVDSMALVISASASESSSAPSPPVIPGIARL